MSEIADELERMAEEFEKRGKQADLRAGSEVNIGEISYWSGKSAAYEHDAIRLRERAAELRAQRSGPTRKPQSKPSKRPVLVYDDRSINPHRKR